MAEEKEAVRQRLVAEVVTAANSLLTDDVLEQIQGGQMRLTEIEAQALAIRQQVGERLTQQMLNETRQGQQAEAVLCPACGEPMQNKGHKTRQIVTRTGNSPITRRYYHCRHCKQGYFPPG